MVNNLPSNAGYTRDTDLIPGSGRSPGVGNSNPLQYSCLEDSMDRGVWQATVYGFAKNGTQPSMHVGTRTRTHTHTHTLTSPILVSLIALVKWVEGSSVPVQSHHVPMQRCHVDDPDLIFFLRAPCHTSSWDDQDRILWDCFLTRLLSGQTLTVPFFMGPRSFSWSTPESPWQGKRNLRTFVAGLVWEHERICESKSSSLLNHGVYFSVVLDLTGPTLVHYFFPHTSFFLFCLHFVKWQVLDPTLNKIKPLYTGEDK